MISQEDFQSWRVQQSCILAQSFIKTASIVNKDYASQDVLGKLEVCVDSMKQLLTHFAMDWTEGTVGDQPIGPIFHVPHSSSKSDFLSGASAIKKKTTDKSTITIADPIPPPPPLPTPSPHHSQSHPFQQPPPLQTKNL